MNYIFLIKIVKPGPQPGGARGCSCSPNNQSCPLNITKKIHDFFQYFQFFFNVVYVYFILFDIFHTTIQDFFTSTNQNSTQLFKAHIHITSVIDVLCTPIGLYRNESSCEKIHADAHTRLPSQKLQCHCKINSWLRA